MQGQPEPLLVAAEPLIAQVARDLQATGQALCDYVFVITAGPAVASHLVTQYAAAVVADGGPQGFIDWLRQPLPPHHLRVVISDGPKVRPYILPPTWNVVPSGGPLN
jgi:hypothetical protein